MNAITINGIATKIILDLSILFGTQKAAIQVAASRLLIYLFHTGKSKFRNHYFFFDCILCGVSFCLLQQDKCAIRTLFLPRLSTLLLNRSRLSEHRKQSCIFRKLWFPLYSFLVLRLLAKLYRRVSFRSITCHHSHNLREYIVYPLNLKNQVSESVPLFEPMVVAIVFI